MNYWRFIPTVTAVTSAHGGTGNSVFPEVESNDVTDVTDVTTKKVEVRIEHSHPTRGVMDENVLEKNSVQTEALPFFTGNAVTNVIFPEVEVLPAPVTNAVTESGNTRPGVSRPPLPPSHWRTGIATFAEARSIQLELCKVGKTWLGRNHDGYYVCASGVDLGDLSHAAAA